MGLLGCFSSQRRVRHNDTVPGDVLLATVIRNPNTLPPKLQVKHFLDVLDPFNNPLLLISLKKHLDSITVILTNGSMNYEGLWFMVRYRYGSHMRNFAPDDALQLLSWKRYRCGHF